MSAPNNCRYKPLTLFNMPYVSHLHTHYISEKLTSMNIEFIPDLSGNLARCNVLFPV